MDFKISWIIVSSIHHLKIRGVSVKLGVYTILFLHCSIGYKNLFDIEMRTFSQFYLSLLF